MEAKSLPFVRLAALGFLLFAKGAFAAILYAAALGTLPAEQGWSLATMFGSPRESVGGGVLNLDTTLGLRYTSRIRAPRSSGRQCNRRTPFLFGASADGSACER